MSNPTHTPDNLINRLSRANIVDKSFKNDSGELIEYKRLILHYSLNGKPKSMELKISSDKADLLEGADIVESQTILDQPS